MKHIRIKVTLGGAKILGRQKSPEGADILFAVKCRRLKQGRSTSHFSLIRQEGSTGLQSICCSKNTEKSHMHHHMRGWE